MADPLWMKVRAVNWEAHSITPERGRQLAKLLKDLSSRKEQKAMRASQQLWSLLPPGDPATQLLLPFLTEIRKISSPAVRSEIDELCTRLSSSPDAGQSRTSL